MCEVLDYFHGNFLIEVFLQVNESLDFSVSQATDKQSISAPPIFSGQLEILHLRHARIDPGVSKGLLHLSDCAICQSSHGGVLNKGLG